MDKGKSAEELFNELTGGGVPASGDDVPDAAGAQETAVSEAPTEPVTEETPAEEAAEPAAEEAAKSPAEEMAEGEAPAMEEAPAEEAPDQRLKSWEGRLKAREAELAAREAALAEQEKPGNEEEAAEALYGFAELGGEEEGAEIDPENAESALADQLGPEFAAMVRAMVQREIASASQGIDRSEFDGIAGRLAEIEPAVSGMGRYIERSHKSAMKQAHPDMDEVIQSPKFAEWVASLPPDEQEAKIDIAQSGTWAETIQMLNEYKDSAGGTDPMEADIDMDGMAAAHGVANAAPINPIGGDGGAGASAEEIFKRITQGG